MPRTSFSLPTSIARRKVDDVEGRVRARFSDIVRVAGSHYGRGDAYKMNFLWTLTAPSGRALEVYDWEVTDSYHDDAPAVEDVRASKVAIPWTVRGHAADVQAFIRAVRGRSSLG